jgi:hypothetical protein
MTYAPHDSDEARMRTHQVELELLATARAAPSAHPETFP